MTGDAAPLSGMRVLEISSFVAAPLGGLTLAQLGADVIRIDPVGGGPDIARWPLAPSGTSLYWTGLNKGKRSVTLDFKARETPEIVGDLVASSGPDGGIVLTNSSRDWLSYQALARHRSDLIHLQIQGRRDGGTAVDYTVNAATGFPLVTGPEDHTAPVNHVIPVWDVACGLYAAVGLLAAERHRSRTGEGRAITLALEDVALSIAGHLGFLAEAQACGINRPRIGNHLYGGFARDFATADGKRVMVVTLTARHFRDLAAVTGLAEVFAQLEKLLTTDFSSDAGRYAHREVIAALLAPWFAERTVADLSAVLSSTSVLWSPYRSFTDVMADPDIAAHSLLHEIEQPGVGRLLAPGSPLAQPGVDEVRPAPTLGADTTAVLTSGASVPSADQPPAES